MFVLFPRVVLEARETEIGITPFVSSNSKVKAKVDEGKSFRLFKTAYLSSILPTLNVR